MAIVDGLTESLYSDPEYRLLEYDWMLGKRSDYNETVNMVYGWVKFHLGIKLYYLYLFQQALLIAGKDVSLIVTRVVEQHRPFKKLYTILLSTTL